MLKWPRCRRRKGRHPQRCRGRFSFSAFLQSSDTFVSETLKGKRAGCDQIQVRASNVRECDDSEGNAGLNSKLKRSTSKFSCLRRHSCDCRCKGILGMGGFGSTSTQKVDLFQVNCNQSAFLRVNLNGNQKVWQSQWFAVVSQRFIPVVNAGLSSSMEHFYHLAASERTFLHWVLLPLWTICKKRGCGAEASS